MKARITADQIEQALKDNPELARLNPNLIIKSEPNVKETIQQSNNMNKLETRYSDCLEMLLRQGKILAWGYESYQLKWAYKLTYTPDFFVITLEGTMEFHETKGDYVREDSIIKLKTAAQLFPWHVFRLVKDDKAGGWDIKVMPPHHKRKLSCTH